MTGEIIMERNLDDLTQLENITKVLKVIIRYTSYILPKYYKLYYNIQVIIITKISKVVLHIIARRLCFTENP